MEEIEVWYCPFCADILSSQTNQNEEDEEENEEEASWTRYKEKETERNVHVQRKGLRRVYLASLALLWTVQRQTKQTFSRQVRFLTFYQPVSHTKGPIYSLTLVNKQPNDCSYAGSVYYFKRTFLAFLFFFLLCPPFSPLLEAYRFLSCQIHLHPFLYA